MIIGEGFSHDTEDEEKQVIPGRTIPASMHTYEFLDKDSMIQCEEILSLIHI